jgi:RNA-directed DNA polymerase
LARQVNGAIVRGRAAAWKRVKRNKGAPGIDGMTIDDYPEFARENWERIASQLRKGNWIENSAGADMYLPVMPMISSSW